MSLLIADGQAKGGGVFGTVQCEKTRPCRVQSLGEQESSEETQEFNVQTLGKRGRPIKGIGEQACSEEGGREKWVALQKPGEEQS